MRAFLTTAALAFAASPAFSQCLTSADLAQGITVTFQAGDYTVTRAMPDGSLQVDESYVNGNPTVRFTAWKGVFFTEEHEIGPDGAAIPGTRLVIEFPVNPAKLPAPVAGGSWSGNTTNVFEDGYRRPEATTITFAAGAPITLSGCTYDTVASTLRYDWGQDGGLTLHYLYLPQVGLAILQDNQFDGEAMSTTQAVAMETGMPAAPMPMPVPTK